MAKRKTHEKFVKEVFELVGEEYSVIGIYTIANEKITMKHNVCNTEYEVIPNAFLHGVRCPKCFGKHKDTTDNYKKKVDKMTNGEFEVIGEYINCKTPILFKHNNKECNYKEFKMTPLDFNKSNIRCPECRKIFKRKIFGFTKEEYQKKLNENCNNEIIIIIGDYINAVTESRFKHITDNCGFEWNCLPSSMLRKGVYCPKCSNINMKRDSNLFKEEVYQLVGNEYEVIGEYVKLHEKIEIKHNICNSLYKVTPAHFLNDRRCPICAESKGEKEIDKVLTQFNIPHGKQYTFDDLRGINNGLLKFDIPVFWNEEKTNLRMLIEYDGIFHYEKQYEGDGFETIQIHDKLKNEYCKLHNIKLIRIPYWDFDNIEEILRKVIVGQFN